METSDRNLHGRDRSSDVIDGDRLSVISRAAEWIEQIDPGTHRRIKGLRLVTAYGIAALLGTLPSRMACTAVSRWVLLQVDLLCGRAYLRVESSGESRAAILCCCAELECWAPC
jgi:hypothetical protein